MAVSIDALSNMEWNIGENHAGFYGCCLFFFYLM